MSIIFVILLAVLFIIEKKLSNVGAAELNNIEFGRAGRADYWIGTQTIGITPNSYSVNMTSGAPPFAFEISNKIVDIAPWQGLNHQFAIIPKAIGTTTVTGGAYPYPLKSTGAIVEISQLGDHVFSVTGVSPGTTSLTATGRSGQTVSASLTVK